MEHNAILDSKLSLSSNIPLYAQLVGIIKQNISSGELNVGDLLPYHRHVDVGTSVDVVNTLIAAVDRGQPVFHDIYPDAARAADPSRQDTGLFYFEGEPGAPFAIISAGGGFSYVGSLHESLPHALELSRRGYHAFALQYRTGGLQVAAEEAKHFRLLREQGPKR